MKASPGPPPGGAFLDELMSSWPGLTRPSPSYVNKRKTWMPATSAGMTGKASAKESILDLRKIRDRSRRGTDFIQELQPIFAHSWIVIVDLDLVKERIHRRPQFCQSAHGAGEVFFSDSRTCFGLHLIN